MPTVQRRLRDKMETPQSGPGAFLLLEESEHIFLTDLQCLRGIWSGEELVSGEGCPLLGLLQGVRVFLFKSGIMSNIPSSSMLQHVNCTILSHSKFFVQMFLPLGFTSSSSNVFATSH